MNLASRSPVPAFWIALCVVLFSAYRRPRAELSDLE